MSIQMTVYCERQGCPAALGGYATLDVANYKAQKAGWKVELLSARIAKDPSASTQAYTHLCPDHW